MVISSNSTTTACHYRDLTDLTLTSIISRTLIRNNRPHITLGSVKLRMF